MVRIPDFQSEDGSSILLKAILCWEDYYNSHERRFGQACLTPSSYRLVAGHGFLRAKTGVRVPLRVFFQTVGFLKITIDNKEFLEYNANYGKIK